MLFRSARSFCSTSPHSSPHFTPTTTTQKHQPCPPKTTNHSSSHRRKPLMPSSTASCQKRIAAVALPLRPLLLPLLPRGSPLSTKFSTTRNTSLRSSPPLDRSGSECISPQPTDRLNSTYNKCSNTKQR